jgi:hypothetical protein
MNRALLIAAALAYAAGAGAQQFKWIDQDGKVRYGDMPPPGVKATPLKPPPAGPAPAPSAKGAAKGPLTPAEQEAAFKKRQIDAEKAQEKQAKADQERQAKQENCARAQEQLRSLEIGRVARVDSSGQRYFLDESQIAAEKAKANDTVSKSCN